MAMVLILLLAPVIPGASTAKYLQAAWTAPGIARQPAATVGAAGGLLAAKARFGVGGSHGLPSAAAMAIRALLIGSGINSR